MTEQGREDGRLAAEAELAALREENVRLRGLLGLDERSDDAGEQWAPTLFGRDQPGRIRGRDGYYAPAELRLRRWPCLRKGGPAWCYNPGRGHDRRRPRTGRDVAPVV